MFCFIPQIVRMHEGDHDIFFRYYCMTSRVFDTLLDFVKSDLTRLDVVREPLEPGDQLAITLRFAMLCIFF